MKRLTLIVLGCALLAVAGCGDKQEQTPEVAMEPAPLLDRELFFGDPEISGSQLSPDGKWMTFLKPHNGARNIWVKGVSYTHLRAHETSSMIAFAVFCV